MKTFYLFNFESQNRLVIDEILWYGGHAISSVQARSWLEAKALLSQQSPYVELSGVQEELLQRSGS